MTIEKKKIKKKLQMEKEKLCDEKESSTSSSWVDLEPLLLECSLQMRSGELIHQKSFGLFEAMSAVEIMDPKMDCGCVTGGGFGETSSSKEEDENEDVRGVRLIKRDDDIIAALTSSKEMKVVVDMLIARENSWHVGNALPPTVFSCLYLKEEALKKLSSLSLSSSHAWPMRAFEALMTTTLPFVGLIKKMVEIGDIFEEEDFNPHDYGLKVPLPEWMQRKESGAGVTAADVLDGDACVAKYEEVLKEGKDAYGDSELYRRICLRFALYRAFKRIADVPTEENGKRIKRDFEEARATARRILEEEDITGISTTNSDSNSNRGEINGGGDGDDNKDDEEHAMFDASACAHALGNSPPRVVELFTVKQSYEYYLKLLDELDVVIERLYDSAAATTTRTHLELSSDDFFLKCRDITDRDFLALSRSVAAYVSTVGGSTDSHLGVDSVDLCLRSVFAQVPEKVRVDDSEQKLSSFQRAPFEYVASEIKKGNYNAVTVTCEDTGAQTDGDPIEILATFKDECQRSCSFLSRAYFASPSRRQRKLRRCLDELSHLQVACSHVDALGVASLFLKKNIKNGNDAIDEEKVHEFCARAFQLWASRIVADAQFDILKVGFQCELYKSYELASVYWYMDNLVVHALNADQYIYEAFNCNTDEVTKKSMDTYLEANIFRARSNAAQCVLAALEKVGLIKMPKRTFTLATAEARFFQRFAHFQANSDPVPLFWDDYEKHVRGYEKRPAEILLRLAHGQLQPLIEMLSQQIESLQKKMNKKKNEATAAADDAEDQKANENIASLRAMQCLAYLTATKTKCARLSATCKLLGTLAEDDLRATWTVDVLQPPFSSSSSSSSHEEAKDDDVFFALSASRKA